jgi:Chemotaxis protein histidine kinase and related kinases
MELLEVIQVDKSKCQHCLACLLVCPVKLCNIVEPDGITINPNLCIGCGECVRACREKGHYARHGIDDFPEFLEDIQAGESIGVLVAPSAAVNYGNFFSNMLTSLRNMGVKNVFDVSFGAEITTYLYLQALKAGAKQPIIAQPCPAIVSYIEIYQPQLIPYLAPTHSPALDAAIWLKSQPQFQSLKLAFLGPCLAKRREIHDPNTKGIVDYSITFESLDAYLIQQKVDLSTLEPSGFDTPEAERAVGYSQPGGLTEAFNRFGYPVSKSDIPRIEGAHEVYQKYLPELIKDIELNKAPVLVDILNCQYGCNIGPASTHKYSHYQVSRIIEKRKMEQIVKHDSITEDKAKGLFHDFFTWLDSLQLDFSRSYSDKSANKYLREPGYEEEERTWNLMHKNTPEERRINCSSCGYGNCRAMMVSIVNGLNYLESCKYYLFKQNEINLKSIQEQAQEIEEARDEIAAWNEELEHTVSIRTQALRNLLDNAGQGFLSFGTHLLIHDEYSSECSRLFGTDITGVKFSQLIFPHDEQQENFLASLLNKLLSTSDPLLREVYLPLLPTEITVEDKCISMEYKLIDSDEHMPNSCMVILTDMTNHRTLESQIEQERNLLKMVVKVILNYTDFIQGVKDYGNFCESQLFEILETPESLPDKVAEIFRHFHTLKGNFSQLGMNYIVEQLHQLETNIVDLQKLLPEKDLTLQDVKDFFAEFDLLSWLDIDLEGLKDILGQDFFSQEDELVISKTRLTEIEKKIEKLLSPNECKILIPELRRLRHKPLEQLLKSYPEYIYKLADRLEKSVYPIIIQADTVLVDPDQFYDFTKSLVHVFRNAVDHGLESADERLELGKDQYSTINCILTHSDSNIHLSISDDGRGIDVEALTRKAVQNGTMSQQEVDQLSPQEAVQLIFTDGLSTKNEATELSGRGVGLAAVLSELKKLGGTLNVTTELGKGTQFDFYFPKDIEDIWQVSISDLMQPLVDTTCQLLKEQLSIEVTHQNRFESKDFKKIELNKVTAIINVRGALESVVLISFSELVMRKAVRNFILDEITPEEEESYMPDVLCELTNIIIGNSLKLFPGLEELLIVDPPISLSSEDALLKYQDSHIWVCKMQTDLGDLSLSIVLPHDIEVVEAKSREE